MLTKVSSFGGFRQRIPISLPTNKRIIRNPSFIESDLLMNLLKQLYLKIKNELMKKESFNAVDILKLRDMLCVELNDVALVLHLNKQVEVLA